jgi:HEAT repeat protein
MPLVLKRTLWSGLCVLGLLAFSPPTEGFLLAQGLHPPGSKRDAPVSAAPPALRPVIVAADGTLSIAARRLTLKQVLDEVSVRAKVSIVLAESLQEQHVSLRLDAVPLEEGLKRLLAAYDVFYLFSPSQTASAAIKGIWVYPKGAGLELEPVPPALWGSTQELEARLEDPDPGIRSETFEALIERKGDDGLPIVQRGLVDPDEGVRLGTLSTAVHAGIEIPTADLRALVLTDSSPSVRRAALEALAGRPEAEAIAASLQSDADEAVRAQAMWLLETFAARGTRKPPR